VVTEAEKKIEKPQLYTFSAKHGAVPVSTKNSKRKFTSFEENPNENENEMAGTCGEALHQPGRKNIRISNHLNSFKGKHLFQTIKSSEPFNLKPSSSSNIQFLKPSLAVQPPQGTEEIQSLEMLTNSHEDPPTEDPKYNIPRLNILKNDDNFTSSTSDSGYVSADCPKNTKQILAKSSRPLPTGTQKTEFPKTNVNTISKETIPLPIKSKKKGLKTKSPAKSEKQNIGFLDTIEPPIGEHNEPKNSVNIKRIASFDNSEELEDFLFAEKHQHKAIVKKSARARNLLLEKKIARESHQESCRKFRAKRKKEMADNNLELDNLTKRNELLKEKERKLRENVDKLKEYYLYALKNNSFSCKNCSSQ